MVAFLFLTDQGSSTTGADEPGGATSVPTAGAGPDAPSKPDDGAATSPDGVYPLPPGDARPARAERLADGDSFDIRWLDTDERDEVRLFGINAPETGACFGDTAREYLDALTSDQDLVIESLNRDDFGRVLANVWVHNLFVNLHMVELGGALVLSDGGEHTAAIQDAQRAAQAANIGLWDPASCGSGETMALGILAIEADAPGQDNLNPNGEWIDIANFGAIEADLTGWSIRDESTRHRYFFPDGFTLAVDASVRVFSGCGHDDSTSLYWCDGDPVWNNGGDTGFLVDPDGRFADSLSYSG